MREKHVKFSRKLHKVSQRLLTYRKYVLKISWKSQKIFQNCYKTFKNTETFLIFIKILQIKGENGLNATKIVQKTKTKIKFAWKLLKMINKLMKYGSKIL